jgi:spore maturation protein CgeB
LKFIKDFKIACIMDEFTYECFKYESNFILLKIESWSDTLIREKIELLLVESAWKGNNKEWQYKISDLHIRKDKTLKEVTEYCQANNIPTVFWNKEDPFNFEHFIEAASYFDYIFTSDSAIVPRYKEILGHDRIYSLPFAAQPAIHNPVDKDKEKNGEIAFAGSWYNHKYSERRKDLQLLLDLAIPYGLHIYDRMNRHKNTNYHFPEDYKSYIQGYLPYQEILKKYKQYKVFINVNTVKNSTTMLARRVFELLACGTPLISNYSLAIQNYLPGLVKIYESRTDMERYLQELLKDKEIRDRLSLLGQREVFNRHTYTHRLESIFDFAGLPYKKRALPQVMIIATISKGSTIKHIINNFSRQKYPHKELVLFLNDQEISQEEWQKTNDNNVKVLRLDEKGDMGKHANYLLDKSDYEYIARFDENAYYAADFLSDLMFAFKYTDASVVGKASYYTCNDADNFLHVKNEGRENSYTDSLCKSTVIVKKDLLAPLILAEILQENKVDLFCQEKSIKFYSTDRFNFVENFFIKYTDTTIANECLNNISI